MTITISTEGGNRLTNWSVYSSSVEKLVIPRIGETVRIENVYYIVSDVIYDVPYSISGYSPTEIRIRVKKKEENEKPKYE